MKVVLDTNVIVSGLLWQGLPNELLKLVKQGKLQFCITLSLLKELSKVLNNPKFSPRIVRLNTSVEELITGLLELLTMFPDEKIAPVVKDDPDDDNVLSCALISGAKYIITGDPHLLELENWSNISILSPRQFIDCIKI